MDNANLKDHKQIGQELELFFSDEIAPGAPFWLPRGMVIFKELEKFIRKLTQNAGYQETSTPIMVKSELFKQSGHWEKFGEHNMYNVSIWDDEEIIKLSNRIGAEESKIKEYLEKRFKEDQKAPFPFNHKIENFYGVNLEVQILNYDVKKGVMFTPPVNYTLKPMNCPESTILYRFRPRSYRELPLRLSEIGRLHRREKAGEVNGLLRVRQITMDDAHLFVREDQIQEEVIKILETMISFYKSFGFEYEFKLGTKPEKFAGTSENWTKAEQDLNDALKAKNIEYEVKEKDGAFYGPKIDMHIKDAQGRDWQLATVQLDFHMPQAFDLKYIDQEGKQQKPVMIHRAIFGSFERFIAILTEHFQGIFPLWLSPIQVQIIPIADRHQGYAQNVLEQLLNSGIRTEVNNRQETMQSKIRDAQQQKIPYMIIVGDREEKDNKIAVRERSGKDLGSLTLDKFLNKLKSEVELKA